MNKKIFFVMILFFYNINIFAKEKLLVAQSVIYDENYERLELNKNPGEEIFEQLSVQDFSVFFRFDYCYSEKHGDILSLIDAAKICSSENAGFMLYGFIQKNSNYWFGNLKLYDSSKMKVVKEFFASDDFDNYERFLNNFISNVISGLEEISGMKITQKINAQNPASIKFELSTFYWTPLAEKWRSVITGTSGSSLAFELIPNALKIKFSSSSFISFSGKFDVSYFYGFGRENSYPLNLHNMTGAFLLGTQFHFNAYNSIFVFCGPSVDFEYLEISELYKAMESHYQCFVGLKTQSGYEISFNKIFSLCVKCDFDFHFNKDDFMTIKPGLSFCVKPF